MGNCIKIFIDNDVLNIKLELEKFEEYFNELSNEKAECEKNLSDFHHRHTIELGSIILEILKLRKLKFKNNQVKFDDAESDERQFQEQVENEKKKHQYCLTDDEIIELKKTYRKAIFLSHPDKVNDIYKEAAQKIFIELKLAYEANNLQRVSEILNDLEKGNYFKTKSETLQEKDLLMAEIIKIKNQIKTLQEEIEELKKSETYQIVINIDNWDEYFIQTKKKLTSELEHLKSENLL